MTHRKGVHFGPPKPVPDQKGPPMTPYDPPILMQNPFLHKKWGCFQKTRAPYLEKWPSYGHVKFEKRNQKISEKLARLTKIAITPSIFEISSKFFLLMVTDGPFKSALDNIAQDMPCRPLRSCKKVWVKLPGFTTFCTSDLNCPDLTCPNWPIPSWPIPTRPIPTRPVPTCVLLPSPN